MLNSLVSMIVAFVMTLGGISADVDSAKLPEVLQRANALVYQMVKLGEEGQPVSQELAHLYMEKMTEAFGLAAEMDGAQQAGALTQIRTALQTQTQTMTLFRKNFPENADPLMSQIMQMLQAHNRVVDLGSTDPLKFEAAVRQMLATGMPEDKTPAQSVGASKGKQSGKGSAKGGK